IVGKNIPKNASVGGYQSLNGAWRPVDTAPFGDGFAMSILFPGAYVFAGRALNMPVLENAPDAENKASLVSKYGLDDFLGKYAILPNANISRYALAGCAARMAGAPEGVEPLAWLGLSARDKDAAVRNQEAYYMLMRLYEARTGTKAETITVRNYGNIAGMSGLEDKFKPSLRAAFEAGLAADAGMSPDAPMKVSEALGALEKIEMMRKIH
ncbi:MAG: hypothetical protein FWF44_01015, partial [Defluviitaleaceae bacterium]|nr:hypothetical protein [Defluviitaleaceae bacterium]